MTGLDSEFWRGRNVFLTGHTGFKGSWMTLVLAQMGARVSGYALAPATEPAMFSTLDVGSACVSSMIADVRDITRLTQAAVDSEADVAIHMAAQPIVSASYEHPVETFETNVMGTVNFLEACRTARTQTVIVVSSDKCYRNPEDGLPFKVGAPLGGKDPYSASKAGTELVVESWRYAFFDPAGTTRLASARAGNVIGGGDWSDNRLLPDAARAFSRGEKLEIRSPLSTRPWQHVLEPVIGYLKLAEELSTDQSHGRAWNFGPHPPVALPVKDVADYASAFWPGSPGWDCPEGALEGFGEAKSLLLDCGDTVEALGWTPSLSVETAIQWTMEWYREFYELGPEAARSMTMVQIDKYLADAR